MITSSNGNAFGVTGPLLGETTAVTGGFPSQRPVTWRFDGILDMRQKTVEQTRTTRTSAFWGYPAASWLHILLSHIGTQVKRRQSQSYKFKEFAKISNFWIWKQTLHATHLLKLLDKMCKYELDPTSIVEDTERTRFCPQTDRRTMWNQYTPFQLRWKRGYNNRDASDWRRHGAHYDVIVMSLASKVISRQDVVYH